MRSITIQLPRGGEQDVFRLAREHEASGERVSHASGADGTALALIVVQITNSRVGRFVEDVAERHPDALFSFQPSGVVTVQAPLDEVRQRVREVSNRSALELVVGALQSIGSWKGLLLYAIFSGVVAAYAVIFNIPYLLTAAMLISPMGGPAMVAAVAMSVGDVAMLGRGFIRFWVSIGVLACAAAATGAAYGLDFSTEVMELISSLSNWAILIALTGGAAGALAQIQSERDSLVTATATGFLVAVSLSPPAAVLGLGVVIGRWDYVTQMAVLLVLTFLGIIFGGALTMLAYGVGPGSPAGSRGSNRARALLGAVTLLSIAGIVLWQSGQAPEFRKADYSRAAVQLTRDAVRESSKARLLQSTAAFTRPEVAGLEGEALLIQVWVAPYPEQAPDHDLMEAELVASIADLVRRKLPGVVPFVEVTTMTQHPTTHPEM
ncbi:hypothetical protein BH23GEM6_BH23GEM6_07130 [soil metagenome]